jgi:P4 family phage/plasmid primase-like protien
VQTEAFVEKDSYAQKVLRQNFGGIPIHDDICEFDGKPYAGIWIVTGGFPCQPFSFAGNRGGKADHRHLWPEMLRVIREARPTWVLGENVAGIITMELDNCLADLEAEGYACWPLVIPACAVDAKHRRDRVWIIGKRIVGHADYAGRGQRLRTDREWEEKDLGWQGQPQPELGATGEDVAYTKGFQSSGIDYDASSHEPNQEDGISWKLGGSCGDATLANTQSGKSRQPPKWQGWSGIGGGSANCGRTENSGCEAKGSFHQWAPEPNVGRVAHGIPNRAHRLRALGNAIVPQVAEEIIRAMIESETDMTHPETNGGSGKFAHQNQGAPTAQIRDAVFDKYGPPFLANAQNKVSLNDRAVAVKCATLNRVRYDTDNQHYERYDTARGLWLAVHEVEVTRMVDDLLLELGRTYRQREFVARISAAKLSSLSKMMRPHDVKVESESTESLLHVSNGVVALGAGKPKLLPHDMKYPFRASSGIPFDAMAKCPKFLKKFLCTALDQADIDLLQKYCGSMVLGTNSCHGILVIRGTPGGGKSTLVSIIEKIIGENIVAHLRTEHLSGRFETSAFLGKRLLVGKDVPGDTLAVSGARMLKSLVGGDLMQAEIKFNAEKQPVRGDYHVVIVSNNNLRIALDGDEEAWGRRLLVVDFKNPKSAKPVPNFAQRLVAEEASGILNWLLAGALTYRSEMERHGHLRLTGEQQARVATLLEDSDNVAQFVKQTIIPKAGRDVTSEELLLCYYAKCDSHNWTPVPMQMFYTRLPDLLARTFKTTRRNDIKREGRAVRGFKNITLA